MKFCFQDLIAAVSGALDCVEQELVGVATGHGKRVACMCIYMGAEMGLDEERLSDLAAYAIMHDNALTEYVHSEYARRETTENAFSLHCIYGERNMKCFPFFHPVDGAIMYHHEKADGSGVFGRRAEETPDYARWICIADQLDAQFAFRTLSEEKYARACRFIEDSRGMEFTADDVELFLKSVSYDRLAGMQMDDSSAMIKRLLPHTVREFSSERLMEIASLFARIIDYKSTFTSLHSQGVAEKCLLIGRHYGFSDEKNVKLYLAGALHDIGKLSISNSILDKPGKLTPEEFEEMKKHAILTHDIMGKIDGFEEIAPWASRHHEKLDGTGYPFGYDGSVLSPEDRLMACIDIYQALTEERPYKAADTHGEAIEIMRGMGNALDMDIVNDLDMVLGSQAL